MLQPKLYSQEMKDPTSEGVLEGDYKGKTILDTKHFIAPIWSDLKKQWAWGGTPEDLARLIEAMKLRYPRGDKREGQVIKAGDNVAERLIHRADDVFNHPDLYARYYMDNGRVSLNLNDPRQEFLYLCYKGDHNTHDSNREGAVSKYIAANTRYEIVSPKKESQKKKRDANKELLAFRLLGGLDGNEDRTRAICEIMDLPGYGPNTDLTGAWLLLKEMGAQNINMSSKYNKTYQDRFIELAELTDEELNINHQVVQARNKGIIRRRQGYYLFNGERLEGLTSDSSVLAYFRKPDNQEQYLKLIDLLKDGN